MGPRDNYSNAPPPTRGGSVEFTGGSGECRECAIVMHNTIKRC